MFILDKQSDHIMFILDKQSDHIMFILDKQSDKSKRPNIWLVVLYSASNKVLVEMFRIYKNDAS